MRNILLSLKKPIAFEIVSELLGTICLASIPYLNKILIDGITRFGVWDILRLAACVTLLWGGHIFFSYVSQIYSWQSAIRFENTLKKKYFQKISEFSYSEFSQHRVGEYLSKLSNDITMLEQNYLTPLKALIKSAISIVVYAVVIIQVINFPFFAVLLVLSVLTVCTPRVMRNRLSRANQAYMKKAGVYTDKVKDLLTGFTLMNRKTRTSFNRENDRAVDSLSASRMKYGKAKVMSIVLSGSAITLVDIAVFIMVGILLLTGQFSIGIAVACFAYAQSFVEPVREILYDLNAIHSVGNIKAEIEQVLAKETQALEEMDAAQGSIRLRNVTAHRSHAATAFNYEFAIGKKYVLTGESGTGKSTLLGIIGGLITDYEGSVELDGANLKNIHAQSLITLNSQNEHIFAESFQENVTLFGTYPFDEQRLHQIFGESFIFHKIKISLDCQKLSGGEQQIVRFCRQILQDKPIVLMDEAFSAIDLENRRCIYRELLRQKNKTLIYVTHEMDDDFLSHFDQVIRMESNVRLRQANG